MKTTEDLVEIECRDVLDIEVKINGVGVRVCGIKGLSNGSIEVILYKPRVKINGKGYVCEGEWREIKQS